MSEDFELNYDDILQSIYFKLHQIWMHELIKEINAAVCKSCEVIAIAPSGWYTTLLYSVLTLNRHERPESQQHLRLHFQWQEGAAQKLRLKYPRIIIKRRINNQLF